MSASQTPLRAGVLPPAALPGPGRLPQGGEDAPRSRASSPACSRQGAAPGRGATAPPAPGVPSAQGNRGRPDWRWLRGTVSGRPACSGCSRIVHRGARISSPHHKSCGLELVRFHLPSLSDVGEMHLTGHPDTFRGLTCVCERDTPVPRSTRCRPSQEGWAWGPHTEAEGHQ